MVLLRPSATAAGALMGLAAVVAWIPSLRVHGGEGSLGADIRASLLVPAELHLEGDPLVLNGRRLVPRTHHNGASGAGLLANETGQDVRVRVAVQPSARELTDRIMVELRAGSKRFARGTVRSLEHGRGPGFLIPRGGRRNLAVHVWLPKDLRTGYAGLLQDLQLELRVSAAHPNPAPTPTS